MISSADLLGEYPAVRYYPRTGDLYFDVLTRLGESASFETVEAEIKQLQGTKVMVATPLALYKLKKGTVRLEDQMDAAALRERFSLEDESDMPVEEFRSIEEMNNAAVPDPVNPTSIAS